MMDFISITEAKKRPAHILEASEFIPVAITYRKDPYAIFLPFDNYALVTSPHGPAFRTILINMVRAFLHAHPRPSDSDRVLICNQLLAAHQTLAQAWAQYLPAEPFSFPYTAQLSYPNANSDRFIQTLATTPSAIHDDHDTVDINTAILEFPEMISTTLRPLVILDEDLPVSVFMDLDEYLCAAHPPEDEIAANLWKLFAATTTMNPRLEAQDESLSLRLYTVAAASLDCLDQGRSLEHFNTLITHIAETPLGPSQYLASRNNTAATLH